MCTEDTPSVHDKDDQAVDDLFHAPLKLGDIHFGVWRCTGTKTDDMACQHFQADTDILLGPGKEMTGGC